MGVLFAGLGASPSSAEYSQLVEEYRSGYFEEAVQSLCESDPTLIRESSREFLASTESQRKAAVLLHSEAAMCDVGKESIHMEAAEEYLRSIENGTFVRRWRLLVAQHYQSVMRPWTSIHHLETARELFPGDTEIQLSSGVAYEVAGWLGSEKMLENAERMFRAVIARDAGHAEAHLRLGRVRELLGDEDGAVAEIEKSISLSDDPGVLVPANLLLGDIHEAKGNIDQAIRLYEAAVAADPNCQPAAALGYALYRAGELARSRQVIEAFLAADRAEPTIGGATCRGTGSSSSAACVS